MLGQLDGILTGLYPVDETVFCGSIHGVPKSVVFATLITFVVEKDEFHAVKQFITCCLQLSLAAQNNYINTAA
jgi:hypothetical protein